MFLEQKGFVYVLETLNLESLEILGPDDHEILVDCKQVFFDNAGLLGEDWNLFAGELVIGGEVDWLRSVFREGLVDQGVVVELRQDRVPGD